MKKIYFTFLLTVLTVHTYAQVDRSKMPAPGPAPEINLQDPKTFEMKNGLQVLVVENHKLPRVSIQLLIDNPPILEGDKAGVSMLTASLLGQGSKNIPKDEFNEEVDFLGARINFGSQSAFASGLSKYFSRILELLAEAAIHPNFVQEEFEKEKQKLLTGLKAQEKDVSAIAQRVSLALAYTKNHPYGEFTTQETVNNIQLTDVAKFYENYFVPANAYLVIIGDVNYDEVEKLVEKFFTPWTKAAPPSFTFSRPSEVQYTQINFVDMPNAVQSEITVENLVDLKKNDSDYLSAIIANEILGGGGEGRLFLNLREDKAYTYGSYSRVGNDKYAPARFRASASVRNAVTDSAVVEILKEMKKIREEPITARELENTKAKYTGSFVMALEDPATIARYALDIQTENLPEDFYKTYLERLNAITIEEVQSAARKYITPAKARIVVTGKGNEVLENLGQVTFVGEKVPIKYYDTHAEPTSKPNYEAGISEDITSEEVLQHYINAIGGLENLKSVSAFALSAEAQMQGMQLQLEMKKAGKDQFMQEIKVAGNSMSKQVINHDTGYMILQGQRQDMGPEELKKMREESILFPEVSMLKADTAIEGIETINGKKAYKIKLSEDKNAFYDVETGLKVQETTTTEMGGQLMTSILNYADYQEVSGILFPFLITQTVGPQSFDFVVQEIKVNEGVTEADFE
ncbi:M16 family metallopeptidase [Pareuzebyella sediminis]|uniref:M16 family metallopeptidase n=1 Tax=Pareuzebyella sediminis TaxID=2607998 RepID=UPI0011F096D9|nr:pitrilysin family protein [Pareuzebyella sediminis]